MRLKYLEPSLTMTHFQLTEALRKVLKNAIPPQEYSKLNNDKLDHNQLVQLYEKYHPTKSLLALIQTTKLTIPNKNVQESKPKTREYTRLMERLRLEAKEKEYKQLSQPKVDYDMLYEPTGEEPMTPAQMNKELKNYVTTIINILLSVVSVAYAIWYWTDTSWKLETSYRVLLSLFFGLVVLVAEVVVYLGYLNKIEEARKAERKKKEVKKVIKTI